MQFSKGMRDRLDKYLDESKKMELLIEMSGNAVYDCCCFGVDQKNQLSDERYMIFYNQTCSPDNEIIYTKEGNRTKFLIDLKKIPSFIQKLVFSVSIDGDGVMSEIDFQKLLIFQEGSEKITFHLAGNNFSTEKAIISVEIYRKDVWRMAAVANGFNGGLRALLAYFGGEEDNKSKEVMQEENASSFAHNMPAVSAPKADETRSSLPRESETFNKKQRNDAPVIVSIKYNPYTVESEIIIDGKEVEPPNPLYDWKDKRIQTWIENLLPILKELCNDDRFQIDFYGLRLDYDDLYEIVKEYCSKNTYVEVCLNFKEAKGSKARIKELQDLFEDMQRNCPFEDLKTKQIQENFYSAISSEFEVSVIATMSSGKSTLINALLSKELMPSKNEACTATIAKIKDNNTGNIFSAVYRDKENKVLGEYSNLTLENMEEMNANPNTAYIDIEGNIPNIDSSEIKLVLVDTPGPNNSRTEEHRNHTYRVIKEKTKPMVLYVLNATQLQTTDDLTLLSTVAEAMKVGGKQSKDRFIFVVNKIDLYDPDKEPIQNTLQNVRKYLEEKAEIINPNIFPTAAETAKVIRMYQNGENLTRGQQNTLSNCTQFIEEKQFHLSEQASLSKNNLLQVKNALKQAADNHDKYQEAMIHTGIPAIELAVNEYLKKYAYTDQIANAVNTFKRQILKKDMKKNLLKSIQGNEEEREKIHHQLAEVRRILDEGQEAKKFKDKIDSLDMMKDAKNRIRKIRSKLSKELNISSDDKKILTTLEVQQLMFRLNQTIQHLQSDVKTELDNIINDVIIDNADRIMGEYSEYIQDLIKGGVVKAERYDPNSKKSGIDFLKMEIPNAQELIDKYKYEESYDTGEYREVKNKNKKWYKPWTWLEPDKCFEAIRAKREMVDYATVENEYLTPVIQGFNENLENAQKAAQKEAENFKTFFRGQISELETAMKKQVEENEKLTENQENIKNLIQDEKEKVQWLENFMDRLDKILEI